MPPYVQQLEPLVLPEQNIGLWEGIEWKYFKVLRLLPLYPGEVYNFGKLAAGASTDWVALKNLLEIGKNEVAQFRILPVDDVSISLRIPPAGAQIAHTKNRIYNITRYSVGMNPQLNLTEFFSYEDNYPHAQCTNPTAYEQNLNRIRLEGFRFQVEELEEEPEKVVKVCLYSW